MTEMAVDSVDRARVEAGWSRPRGTPSLSEVFGSIATRPSGSFWRKLLTFLGPGYLVAVGYMDPGNWATSLAGGSQFGYAPVPGGRPPHPVGGPLQAPV